MQCPRCQTTLAMSERQGVEIDYCPQCRGVWLDRGELDKIIERGARPEVVTPTLPPERMAHQDDRWVHSHHKPKRKKSFLEDVFDF